MFVMVVMVVVVEVEVVLMKKVMCGERGNSSNN